MAFFEQAQDQARLALRNRRHLEYSEPDDFNIETGESVMDLWNSATQGIYVVTLVVTGISLLVGGVVVSVKFPAGTPGEMVRVRGVATVPGVPTP